MRKSSADSRNLVVLVCFFLSGVTGLIYEILWTRMIVSIIGAAPFAESIVLTVFMGGLGLGSYIASKVIDRIQRRGRLIALYGILELLTGAYGIILPIVLPAFKLLYSIIYNRLFGQFVLYNLITFLGCSILLILPVVCMGATLPILCRFYVTRLSHLGTHAGRLYGLNTIGAAFGAFLCGFWLINYLGVWGTLALAVFINGVIGISCLVAGAGFGAESIDIRGILSTLQHPVEQKATSEVNPRWSSAAATGVLIIFAVSGFCAMSYEVIWTRLMGLIIGPTTYSFTIVLVTFISGLALGSMFFGWVGDKSGRPILLLTITQISAALSALAVSQVIGNSQMFFAKLILNFRGHFAIFNFLRAVILFGFMFLPTFCLGATFPLVGKIFTRSLSKVGWSIGFAYTINTIGAVLGSFCAGFVLIHFIGKEKGLSAVTGLQLITAFIVAAVILDKRKSAILKWLFLTAPVMGGLILCVHYPVWNRQLLSTSKYHHLDKIEICLRNTGWPESLFRGPEILSRYESGELLYYGEGIGGFTTVMKYTDAFGNFQYSMVNNGKADASSRGDMMTQTLLAHFPMLFHHNPKTVMVLGLASGITAGEVLCYPIERLDVLEISEQVVDASVFFNPWNNEVLSNPRTRLIIQDGRAHLQLTNQRYDVITSEPSNPWMAGLATLFTEDFFRLSRDRLNENGIFVQWVHSYDMDWATFSLIGRTFAKVFPNNLLVSTQSFNLTADYLLVGLNGDEGLSLSNSEGKLDYVRQSKNVKIIDPKLLYRLILSEDVSGLFGPGRINTDGRPRLEFAAPKLLDIEDPIIKENITRKRRIGRETAGIIQQAARDIDSQIDFAEYSLSLHRPFYKMVDLSQATPEQKERYFKLMEQYCRDNMIDYSMLEEELKQRCRSVQTESIKEKMDTLPRRELAYSYLAELYLGAGMLDEAASSYYESLKIKPDSAEVHKELGTVLRLQGRFDEAIRHYQKVLEKDRYSYEVYNELGGLQAIQGRLDEAIKYYRKALELEQNNCDTWYNLGTALASKGNFTEAAACYRRAIQIRPDDARGHNSLGMALFDEGQVDEAMKSYHRALELSPEDAGVHYNIGFTLLIKNEYDGALKHFREVLRIKPDYAAALNWTARILATHPSEKNRDPNEAIFFAERAVDLSERRDAITLDTLAICYAAAGRYEQAIETAQKAVEFATAEQNSELVNHIRKQLQLYRDAGKTAPAGGNVGVDGN